MDAERNIGKERMKEKTLFQTKNLIWNNYSYIFVELKADLLFNFFS